MATIDVLTNRYNGSRTGANLAEGVLNQSNVNPNSFGKLFARSVDGQIYAQPLIVSSLQFPGGNKRDVVYVCTTRNNVYAFDATDPAACNPIWQQNLGPPVPRGDYGIGYSDFSSEIGITSTPAIDRATGTIYLVAKTKENVSQQGGTRATYVQRLHALDLVTGVAKNGPATIAATVVKNLAAMSNDLNHRPHPVDLSKVDQTTLFDFVSGPSVPGTGDGSVNQRIKFNSFFQHNRPGLLLLGGVVYLGFASHGDIGVYHGWVLAYDAATLELLGTYCTTADSGEGGIWQSGCGLAGDTPGEVFAVAGNGKATPTPTPQQLQAGPFFGQSVLKLKLDRVAKTLSLADWFVPFQINENNANDEDLCAGPVLLPWNNLVGGFGKDRAYYIMDRNSMGHFTPGQNHIAQYAQNMTTPLNDPNHPLNPGGTGHIHGAPVVFHHPDPDLGPISYVWGENDDLRGYRFDVTQGKFETTPLAQLRSTTAVPVGMPGGMLSISYDGSDAKSAIVWASHPADFNGNHTTVAGVLQAFAADDLTQPIWRSNHDPLGTDDVGNFAKFCPPVVANGRVYLATFSNELVVYGILPGGVPQQPIGPWSQADVPPPALQPPPIPGDDPTLFRVEGSASFSCNRFTILGSGHDIWGKSDGFHFVSQPSANGSLTITARVVNMTTDISPWSKAGVMIRESLDAGAVNAMVAVTPANGFVFQFRQTTGGDSAPVLPGSGLKLGGMPGAGWVRLTRAPAAGGKFVFTGFASIDGVHWQQIQQPATFTMNTQVLVGLAVCAHNDPPSTPKDLDELCVATIDKVTLS